MGWYADLLNPVRPLTRYQIMLAMIIASDIASQMRPAIVSG
jgi:hypothetical protein